jgi:hypothetical protein
MSAPPVRLRAGVVCQAFNGETVLLDVAAGHYFGLNASGTVMLEQLLAGSNRDDTVAEVMRRFDVDAPRAASDLDSLLETLRQARLIEGP